MSLYFILYVLVIDFAKEEEISIIMFVGINIDR